MTGTTVDILEWAGNHIHLLGWPVLIGIVWKVRGAIDGFITEQKTSASQIASTLKAVEDAKQIAIQKTEEATAAGASKAEGLMKKIEEQATALHTISENHLVHLAEDMKEHRDEQRVTMDKHLEVLQSIDKNIAVMASLAGRKKRV